MKKLSSAACELAKLKWLKMNKKEQEEHIKKMTKASLKTREAKKNLSTE